MKQGPAFLVHNDEVASRRSERTGRSLSGPPTLLQLDRAAFDEEVLAACLCCGAQLFRPASVTDVQLSPGQEQTITIRKTGRAPKQFALAGWSTHPALPHSRAKRRLVEIEYGSSDRRRMVALERGEGLG